MSRLLLYVAHPVAPTDDEIAAVLDSEHQARPRTTAEKSKIALGRNLDRAMRWLSWLRRSFPETTFIAPWIASIMAGGDDSDPKQREAGLLDCCAVVERCDGIVLCGGRISSGMRREMEHAVTFHDPALFEVHDLTMGGAEPPGFPPGAGPNAKTFEAYMDAWAVVRRMRGR